MRPQARVVLRWSCLPDPAKPLDFSDCPDVDIFYAHSQKEPEGFYRDYGLCRRLPDGTLDPLGLPVWKWEAFYTEIIRSIFDGTWGSSGARAINYWWGMTSGVVDVICSQNLPLGMKRLVRVLKGAISSGEFNVFSGVLHSQSGIVQPDPHKALSPEEIVTMDWLADNVIGEIPPEDKLEEESKAVVQQQGVEKTKG